MRRVGEADTHSSAVFVEPAGLARRPADVITLIIGLAIVWLMGLRFRGVGSSEGQFVLFLQGLPDWTTTAFRWMYFLGALYAAALFLVALVKVRSYPGLLRVMLVALIGAVGADTALLLVVTGEWPRIVPELAGDTVAQYLALRITTTTAVLAVASPYLTRPFRRLGWVVVLVMLISSIGIGVALPSHALAAVGLGLAAAGLANVLFGSPDGYPNLHVVASSLDVLGVEAVDLEPSDRQSWGVRRFDAVSATGQPMQIKVYSRDANDAQFWSKLWRFLWFRDSGPEFRGTRLQQVEHEALMHLMAAQGGVNVASVLTAARTNNGDAVLALGWDGVSMAEINPAALSDAELRSLWGSVARLHRAGLAHGQLDLAAARLVAAGTAILGELGKGSIAAPESRPNTDVAELLFSTATAVGPERAVASAVDGLGKDRLLASVPYLQAPAISLANRSSTRNSRSLLASLRDRVSDLSDSEPPEPAELKRVSRRNVLTGGLALIVGYVLISELAGLDWAAILVELKNAQWVWVAVGFVTAQLVLVPEMVSLMAVVDRKLPVWPSLVLQSASKFVGTAIPGPAGRVAMLTAFMRGYGVSPVRAVSQSSVDSLAGFITEVTILICAFAFFGFRFGVQDQPDSDWSWILVVILVIVAVVILTVALRPTLRKRIVPVVREAWAGLSVVVRQPSRLIVLFGANLGTRLISASALWMVLQAFGITLPLSTALFITVAALLLSGIIPVPGGVGVAEAALTIGLVGAGVDENVAFAVAVVYRLISFYLPPVLGYFSLRWLEKEDYL